MVRPCRYATLGSGLSRFFGQRDYCLGPMVISMRPYARRHRLTELTSRGTQQGQGYPRLVLSDFSGHCERVDAGQATMTGVLNAA